MKKGWILKRDQLFGRCTLWCHWCEHYSDYWKQGVFLSPLFNMDVNQESKWPGGKRDRKTESEKEREGRGLHERALQPRNAWGKIKLKRRKTKSRAGKRQRQRENQYLALKWGLRQRCNYAKCVLFTLQSATEISQPGGQSRIRTLQLKYIKNYTDIYRDPPPHCTHFWHLFNNTKLH